MKCNAGKCHLIVRTNNTVNIKIGNINITNSICEKFLGVKFDCKLTFYDHVFELRKKASREIHRLTRVTSCINLLKTRIFMNSCFKFKTYSLSPCMDVS